MLDGGHDPAAERGTLGHPLDNGPVHSSRPTDVANSSLECHAAAMRTVATDYVATVNFHA